MTVLIAPWIAPESAPNTPTTASVITPRTTAYSAIVWPSSRETYSFETSSIMYLPSLHDVERPRRHTAGADRTAPVPHHRSTTNLSGEPETSATSPETLESSSRRETCERRSCSQASPPSDTKTTAG